MDKRKLGLAEKIYIPSAILFITGLISLGLPDLHVPGTVASIMFCLGSVGVLIGFFIGWK